MTEPQQEPGRIDLRAIDDAAHSPNVDRIIAAAIAGRIDSPTEPANAFAFVASHSRILFAAAATLLIVTTGAMILTEAPSSTTAPEVALVEWTRGNHVPTNGELLSAFQRYGQ